MIYVAFLRAINVGGHTVKMDRLKALFEELRLANVETFIASGNVLFDTAAQDIAALESRIERKLHTALGYEVTTFIRPLSAMPAIAAAHPFAGFEAKGITLSVGFLKEPATPLARKALAALVSDTDDFHIEGREAYWLARTGVGNSKLMNGSLQKALGAATTFRNVNTVRRLAAKL